MLGITLANLRAHKGRLLLSSLAIVLATAFVAAAFVFTDAMRAALFGSFAEDLGESDVVVSAPENKDLPEGTVDTVRQVDGITHAEHRITWDAVLRYTGDRLEPAKVVSLTPDTAVGWPEVTQGRLPDQPGEAVLDQETAQSRGEISVGDTVEVPRNWDGSGSDTRDTQELRVVGLVDTGDSPEYGGLPFVGVTEEQVAALTDDAGAGVVLAVGSGGGSAAELAERVTTAVDSSLEARTAEEHASQEVSSGGTTASMTAMLLAFAGIALFVAAIVIANTFSILITQRTREMALLRCVGASRGQVFRSVLAESLVLGAAGSIVGVATGFGLAYGVGAALEAALDDFPFGAVTLTPLAVVVPVTVGVVVTVIAALLPARAATRIPPVAALRDQAVPTRRGGWLRLALAVLMLVPGVTGLVLGTLEFTSQSGFYLALAGGAAAFLGVLLAGPVLVPPLIRLVGAVFGRPLGASGRLAAVNTVRNPRRATATTTALLVGVTLITLMSVGAESLRATVDAEVDDKFPVDYRIASESRNIPESMVDDVRDIPDIAHVTAIHGVTTRVDGSEVDVGSLDSQEFAAMTSQLPQLGQLDQGEVVVTDELATRVGLSPGDVITLGGESGSAAEFTVSTVSIENQDAAYVRQQELTQIFPNAPIAGIYADAAPEADLVELGSALDRVTAGSDVGVSGAAKIEATYTEAVDTVLLVVTALLVVAVLIAVVGIANTLALSVIERTRESALLRALGLTRGQLRTTLAVEAALLAIVGALLGVGLGTLFGWVGLTSMVGSDLQVVLDVPWLRLAGLIAGAVLAGLLASVLPARRAARTSVVSALADE